MQARAGDLEGPGGGGNGRGVSPPWAATCGTTTPARTLAWSIDVPTLRGEHIAEITSFVDPDHFVAFGLPASVP